MFRAVFSFTGQADISDYRSGHPVFWCVDIEHASQGPYLSSWPVPPNTPAWNASTAYIYGDFVYNVANGKFYVCTVPNTNVQPPGPAVSKTTVVSASQSGTTFNTAAQAWLPGTVVYMTGTGGGQPGGFFFNVDYFVLATGLTSTTCQLAATPGGPAIAATTSVNVVLNTGTGAWCPVPVGGAGPQGFNNFFEIDMPEYDAGEYYTQNGVGNWFGNSSYDPGISSTYNHYNIKGGPGAGGVAIPGTPDLSQLHTYDCLWVPATPTSRGYINFYFDGVLTGQTIDPNGNLNTNTWAQWQTGQTPPPVWNASAMAGMDFRHMYLILGGGPHYPTTYHSIQVWQADAAHNVTGQLTKMAIPRPSPPAATHGSAYSYQLPTPTGGTGIGQSWEILYQSGNNYSISPSGFLTSTPGTAGTDTVICQCVDNNLYTAVATLSIVVH